LFDVDSVLTDGKLFYFFPHLQNTQTVLDQGAAHPGQVGSVFMVPLWLKLKGWL
jgi:hypothetical protein